MRALSVFVAVALLACATAELFFQDNFSDESWEKNWVYSEHPGKEFGKFIWTAGKFYNDENDKGLKTSQDARFYALSRKFKPFSNAGKQMIVQFSVKHEQDIDCGGGYVKVFDCKLNQKDMHGESPYEIMFGPDICGPGTKKVHVIFSYKGKNLLINKDIRCKDDVFTHLYTLVVNTDNTYEVLIDNEKVESGSLEADWDFLAPKKIKDPAAKKPEDWDDKEMIPDPEDTKPEDWDKAEHVPDPNAVTPEDWDEEMDGEWEPPMIDNPEYKGEWTPKQIKNPNYKGVWIHPEIDNPEYEPDDNLYSRKEICTVGLDLWQVKAGTIFDNFLITDDLEAAKAVGEEIKTLQEAEKKMKAEEDSAAQAANEKESDSTATDDDEDLDDEDSEDFSSSPSSEDHDEL
ncbi:calreticulin [Arctopsyche grandis]|uniref:calreticulin n=1 Tax=Arctopsyche grandis TaxID=121162 RepID=UPI00406DA410